MTATQLPLDQRHYNRQLFADYYLNTVLPDEVDQLWRTAPPRMLVGRG